VGRVNRGQKLSNSIQADAKFLRRIFIALVILTLCAGGMVGLTTAQAMTENQANCLLICQ
jgi:hypothetical protein